MQAGHLNAVIQAASTVLEERTSTSVERGQPSMYRAHCTRHDVTALVGIAGDVRGLVLVGMSTVTARRIASALSGETFAELDSAAQEAIRELGVMFSGKASLLLGEGGATVSISPPSLVLARGTLLTAHKVPHMCIPLRTSLGDVDLCVMVPEGEPAGRTRPTMGRSPRGYPAARSQRPPVDNQSP